MLVANIKIWKSHLNIREGSDYAHPKSLTLKEQSIKYHEMLPKGGYMKNIGLTKTTEM